MSLSAAERTRYSRHLLLPEVGVAGQEKLRAARVLVVGAGGLGSPAALYLAAAGVGTLGIADFDAVEPHNLHRQLLHDDTRIGQPKTASAAARLRATNPFVTVREHPEGVTAANALALFGEYDVIVDGTDNFSTRYLNNDAAVLARRPLVYGSVFKFSGQVAVFAPHLGGACQRCLFPEPPAPGTVPGCGEAGVLGALCGVIGSFQALEAIKLLVGLGEPLIGRLLTYDALGQASSVLRLPRDPSCPVCGEPRRIQALSAERYAPRCEPIPSPAMPESEYPFEVDVVTAKALRDARPAHVRLIDVREPHEVAICRIEGAEHIPLRQIPERVSTLPRDAHLLLVCHHGGRSERATQYLRAQGFQAVTNVAGGIDAWAEQIEPGMARY